MTTTQRVIPFYASDGKFRSYFVAAILNSIIISVTLALPVAVTCLIVKGIA